MDRYAIFIDAGYLLAAAGDRCFGTSRRADLILHPEKATVLLRTRCDSHAKQVHLRTYWYDAAPDAVPTDDQLHIGGQQGVKLRLGRLTKHGQKGVDSRIVRHDCTQFISRRAGKAGEAHLNIPVNIATDVSPAKFGEACGRATRGARDAEAVGGVLANRPRIPRLIDVWLIKEAANRFGDPLPENTKRQIRAGFWKGLSTATNPDGDAAVDEASGDVRDPD